METFETKPKPSKDPKPFYKSPRSGREISFNNETKTAIINENLQGETRRRVFSKKGEKVFVEDFITDPQGVEKSTGQTEYLSDVDTLITTLATIDMPGFRPSERELKYLPNQIVEIYSIQERIDNITRIQDESTEINSEIMVLDNPSSDTSYYKELFDLEYTIPEAENLIRILKVDLKNALEAANKTSTPENRAGYVEKVRDLRTKLGTLEEKLRILQERLREAKERKSKIEHKISTVGDLGELLYNSYESINTLSLDYLISIIQERVKNKSQENGGISAISKKLFSMSKDFNDGEDALFVESEIASQVQALIFRVETYKVINFIEQVTNVSDFNNHLTEVKSRYEEILRRLFVGTYETKSFHSIIELIKKDEELSNFFGGRDAIESSLTIV